MAATAISILVKGTVLLLATFGLARVLRGASAAARHLVWTVGLVGLIAMPVAELSMPWRLEVLPLGEAGLAATASPAAATDHVPSNLSDPSWRAAEPRPVASAAGAASKSAVAEPSTSPSPGQLSRGISLPGGWDWPRGLLVAWALGAALVLGRLGLSVASVWWLARRARPLTSADWYGSLGRVTERLSLRTPVRLLESERTPMPITCGVLRPSVVLPAGSRQWDAERREVVLLHELAHVRRADLVPHLTAWVACAAWWFHPMAWVAARRLRAESEFACDDLVLGAGTRASVYAEHLLEIVRKAGRTSSPALAMPMAQRAGFEGRLLSILEPDIERGRPSRTRRVALVAGLSAVAISLAAMAPARPGADPAAGEKASAGIDPSGGWIPLESEKEPAGDPLVDGAVGTDSDRDVDIEIDGMRLGPADTDAPAATIDALLRGVGTTDAGKVAREAIRDGDTTRDVARLGAQLAVALKDVDVGVRVAAARALGAIDDPRSVEALSKALRSDPSVEVRRAAAWALGEIESPAGIPALAEAIRGDSDAEVRKTAAWALGEIESAGGVDALGAALSDGSPEVRAMAIWALGEIESAAAVKWLEKPLREGTLEERRKAAWALGEIESAAAVDALGGALSDPDAEVRSQAAWALGEIEAPQAVPWLTRALGDGSPEVRKKAAWALGEIESPQAVEALAAALSDSNVEVRKLAAWALGEIQPDRAPRRLIDASRDSSSEVRENVAWALGEIADPAAVPALRAMLDDPNTEVRKDALHALMEFDDTLAEDVLLDLLKSDDAEVRQEAARALGKKGNR